MPGNDDIKTITRGQIRESARSKRRSGRRKRWYEDKIKLVDGAKSPQNYRAKIFEPQDLVVNNGERDLDLEGERGTVIVVNEESRTLQIIASMGIVEWTFEETNREVVL